MRASWGWNFPLCVLSKELSTLAQAMFIFARNSANLLLLFLFFICFFFVFQTCSNHRKNLTSLNLKGFGAGGAFQLRTGAVGAGAGWCRGWGCGSSTLETKVSHTPWWEDTDAYPSEHCQPSPLIVE